MKDGVLDPLDVMERLAIISVVGDGMRTLRGISALSSWRAPTSISSPSPRALPSVQFRWWSAMIPPPPACARSHQMLFNTDQVIEVFVIGVGGVGGALIEQIYRQQPWLKQNISTCGCAASPTRA